ncbi:c-type cytochrome [Woeseia oceani]|uniref:Cytochrome c domain-containing protein n=1 Tax=Woeseia oceani TaxID=1548547 RepID=A0A193LFJ4_9GAMM|nr:hypothetical protein [Woeseia oceani]ANO51277.1 hypothetical protein BA177_08745 [Woeseia oceani]
MSYYRVGLRRLCRALIVVASGLFLAACEPRASDAGPPALTAMTLGIQDPRPVSEYLSAPEYANASPELGDRLLMLCASCHSFDPDRGHMLGPNLYGLFGRRAGSLEDFGYTRALSTAEFVWTPRALDAWLTYPSQFLPGNAMAFGGIKDPDDRNALIASLLRRTSAATENN